jgi:hypothetical protein
MMVNEGGCLCGAVRYRVKGSPLRGSACHCTTCQRRTGSAFGYGAYFREEDVEFVKDGERRSYEHRSDETGRWLRFEFCVVCGTQLTWTVEASPGLRAIGIGTLDDPKSVVIKRFGWFRSAQPWIVPPRDFEIYETSTLPPPGLRLTK